MSDLSDLMHARTPPHSSRAEQSVLGCVLMDPAVYSDCAALISGADFYHAEHGAIWSTMQVLAQGGVEADVVTVYTRGGGAHSLGYLNELAACVASPRSALRHAALVRDASVRRQAMAAAADLVAALQDDAAMARPVGEMIDATMVQLLALLSGSRAQEPQVVEALLPTFIDELNKRADGHVDAISTGLRDVDRMLAGGPRRGELIVIGARPSMGKSALSLTIARNVAARHVALVCSMEDSEQMLVARQVAASGRVNLADIRMPQRAPDSMWTGVSDGVDLLKPLRLYIDDQPALTLADVRRKMAQVKRRSSALDVVVVDYLQLMRGDGDNRHQVLGAIAAGLKAAAKEYQVAVVLLSQLNREADKTSAPPRLDHLRESGGIEEAADIVGLLWREHRSKPRPDNKHDAQVEFAKNKNGATGTVRLWFDGQTQRFCDAAEESDYA